MATIKAIDSRSVHQIQSGQVIVDLCSVVKELVENSLDAHATSVDIRFKNNGLDLIEVQDNGDGIPPKDYDNIALKHFTSKLSTYGDLTSLQTFGFRGEALSSLCALSDFHIVTATADQVPKASRLDFEASGKLKGTQVVAGQRGATAAVENLFSRLPVRRRELNKNIKREYGKVLALLHAYACISTGVRFSVKNQMPKGKSVLVFSTKSNATTRENISNVYGAKTLNALTPLGLELELEPSGAAKKFGSQNDRTVNKILVHGHISKPVLGEGRQTPDRQMFFVNSRPCGLPQIAKAFNEVYKSFNISQSPFIFANFEMDTSSYDVNVSPDKRTILLHDAGNMIESLKEELTELFENLDQTVPQSQILAPKQTSMKEALGRHTDTPAPASSMAPEGSGEPSSQEQEQSSMSRTETPRQSMQNFLQRFGETRPDKSVDDEPSGEMQEPLSTLNGDASPCNAPEVTAHEESSPPVDDATTAASTQDRPSQSSPAPSQTPIPTLQQDAAPKTPSVVQNAFDRMRPKRTPAELATITIGNKTVTSSVGGSGPKRTLDQAGLRSSMPRTKRRVHTPSSKNLLGQSIRSFAAPGTQAEENRIAVDEEESELGPEPDEAEEQAESSEPSGGSDGGGQSESEAPHTDEASDSDGSYVHDAEQKLSDEAKVKELIDAAEKTAAPSEHHTERMNQFFKRSRGKESTVDLMCSIDGSISRIETQLSSLQGGLRNFNNDTGAFVDIDQEDSGVQQDSAEKKLSLTVSKDDFSKMRVVGQFNLGFILATRSTSDSDTTTASKDELFIIDQHASDEKFNFERLQAETVVQNQRLVQPKTLDLTAVEEEVIIDNLPSLEKNGFLVDVDTSGDEPIGRRCKLLSLPLSKEVVFNDRDLEELIVLLSEAPHRGATSGQSPDDRYVPRPSKVRKMFAMRACRSSIMVGKTLTERQMERVVRHMGMIDKPWNCPHGRPTMRHLMSLGQWNEWDEWDKRRIGGEFNEMDTYSDRSSDGLDVWRQFLEKHETLDEH